MTKEEARRLSRVAHNAADVLHFVRLAGLDELSVEAYREQFARGKDDAAVKKAWNRLKRELEEIDVVHLERDGKFRPLRIKRGAARRVEELIEETQRVLKPPAEGFLDEVTVGGQTYRLKVYGRSIRPLNPRECAELRASLAAEGVKVPVLVDPDGNVVDGKHRLLLAQELGLKDVPVAVFRGYTREQLHALAEELNACRRHLTKREQAERRRAREARARGERSGQRSLRQIAEEEGVHPETIRRDVADAANVPSKVVGKDGRRRPARKARPGEREERRREVARLHAEEKSIQDIAAALEVGTGTVKRDLRALRAQAAKTPRVVEEEIAPGCFLRVEELPGEDSGSGEGAWAAEEEVASDCFLRVEAGASSWRDVDPGTQPVSECLDAVAAGLGEVLADVRGTAAEAKVRALRELVRALRARVEGHCRGLDSGPE